MNNVKLPNSLSYVILVSARLNPNSDVKEVMSDPRNINIGMLKKGKTDEALFSRPGYVTQGNPFREAARTLVRREDRSRQIEVGNEKAFRPAKHVRQPTNAAFQHMKDYEQIEKNYRDAEDNGAVIIGPRNIQTNPPKRGRVGKSTTFSGMIPYTEDDFNRPKLLANEERLAGKSLEQDKPFSQKVKRTHMFNTFRAVIGEDIEIPQRPPAEKRQPLMEHDKPFKPSHPPKIGYNKTFMKFPEYKEDPKKPIERKMDEEDGPKKFKPTHNSKSRPTPSITTNMRNLKASFPSVFRK